MPIGRSEAYHQGSSSFSVIPRQLAAPPSQEREDPGSRAAVVARATRSLTARVPPDEVRSAVVGRQVLDRVLTQSPFDAYASQRRESPSQRERASIRSEVSSAAGGAVQSVGQLLDVKV